MRTLCFAPPGLRDESLPVHAASTSATSAAHAVQVAARRLFLIVPTITRVLLERMEHVPRFAVGIGWTREYL
jgi:hypothetical protein